ncbi:transglutaminase family protein [Solilutibacter silvestris]|uniref:Transglutaminase-like protein n=1 Tax=Solilutibacter silvestris TaxID=1645665 RepID=A0A2K1Q232_9GAMM|nr:transglutaminase family protein [Lysobacter silvestris]PNS09105.1 Transglutaminase-like protein [Lysobacter silvestris]
MRERVNRVAMGLMGVCLALMAATACAASPAPQEATLRQLLQQPEGAIDLARAKIAIDRVVDPSIDSVATLRLVEQWAAKARARFPVGASNKVKMDLLISTMYESGPWNDHRPFSYDYSDPFGQNVKKSLLSTYLATRKGQCVIMPIAFLVIGQRLGLPLTITTAPHHLIVKYGDEEQGQWTNFEATSGLFHPDSGYEQSMNISPEATRNGIYLRPFTQHETVAVFATASLLPYYRGRKQSERMLAVTDLILKANPKDVDAMTIRGDAYYLLIEQRFKSKYPKAEQIPMNLRAEYLDYSRQNNAWYEKAEALGWRQWGPKEKQQYLQHFNSMKAKS